MEGAAARCDGLESSDPRYEVQKRGRGRGRQDRRRRASSVVQNGLDLPIRRPVEGFRQRTLAPSAGRRALRLPSHVLPLVTNQVGAPWVSGGRARDEEGQAELRCSTTRVQREGALRGGPWREVARAVGQRARGGSGEADDGREVEGGVADGSIWRTVQEVGRLDPAHGAGGGPEGRRRRLDPAEGSRGGSIWRWGGCGGAV